MQHALVEVEPARVSGYLRLYGYIYMVGVFG